MRIQLISQRRRSEHGAIAVLVAAMALALFLLCGFAIDFGMAYNSKRQLQTAADSGALAGAAVFAKYSGTCATLLATPAIVTEAQNAAVGRADDNRSGQALTWKAPTCVGGNPQVTVNSAGTTSSLFGRLGGIGDNVLSSRSAAAVADVPNGVLGLRPYAICSASLPAAGTTYPTPVMRVGAPGGLSAPPASAGCPIPSGNWWTIDCPEDTNGSGTATLANRVQYGCSQMVSIVPNQPATGSSALGPFLIAACPVRSSSCLSSNPGNLAGQPLASAWDTLLGKTIIVPVFCGQTACNPAGVDPGAGGTNGIYPVYRLAAMTVCGYHWKNKTNGITTGSCANNPSAFASSDGGSGDDYMLVSFTNVIESGDTSQGTCQVGDPTCDFGARRVRLSQ